MSIDNDAIDYEKQLMAGLALPEPADEDTVKEYIDRLHLFTQKISLNLLTSEHKALFACMDQYFDKSDGLGLLDEQALLDMLIVNKASTDIQVKYVEMFRDYQSTNVSAAKFRYSLNRFLEVKEEQAYLNALNETFLILTSGVDTGYGKNKKTLKGYRDSKVFLYERLNDIEFKSESNSAPEGDIRIEASNFIAEVTARKEAPQQFVGCKSGISPLDDITNGVQPGELVCLGAYVETGKTFFMLNWGHHAVTNYGKNILVFTSEVPREQYKKRGYLRHCRNPQFGLPQGIDADAFKTGRLSPQEIQGVEKAMDDFQNNPAYGLFDVIQVPTEANINYVMNKANSVNAQWMARGGVQLIIVDSLNQISPSLKADASQTRIALNDMVKKTKKFAVNFDRGRGVPVLATWHVNRKSWEEALKEGKYNLKMFAESDEVERSADLVMWLLKTANSVDTHEILMGLEKYRDGKAQKIITLYEDFASSYMGTVATTGISSGSIPTPVTGPGSVKPTFDPKMADLF